jgi:hypothetical protein
MNLEIAIKDLLPNPFRDMAHYKINKKKVEQLIQSFKTTGFWPVLIGRKNAAGKVEIAFGHHRKAAGEELYGSAHKVLIIIQELSDAEMLKMMANENQQDFSSSFVAEMETIEAVVKAFAAGKISLRAPKPVPGKGFPSIRFAPSFLAQSLSEEEAFLGTKQPGYLPSSVAEFLGWLKPGGQVQERVRLALAALELQEQGYLEVEQLEGLGTMACERVIRNTAKSRDKKLAALERAREYLEKLEAEAAEARGTPRAKEVAGRLKEARSLYALAEKEAKRKPAEVAAELSAHEKDRRKKDKEAEEVAAVTGEEPAEQLPDIEEVAHSLGGQISNYLSGRERTGKQLKEVIDYRQSLDDGTRAYLAGALERLAKRSAKLAAELSGEQKQLPNSEHGRLLAA